MKIATLQMTSGSIVSANLQQARTLISEACAQGANLMVLPENFAFFAKQDSEYLEQAETLGQGEIQQFLKQQAINHQCHIVAGVVLKSSNSPKVKESVLMFNPKGEQIARYNKMHLFDVTVPGSDEKYQESDVFEPGNNITVIETALGRIGLCVCFDLRFPELFRLMLEKGVDIILIPSAFTKLTGQAHWEILLKARAIENLSFIAAANQSGFHVNGRETYGHSMIIDPWGNTLDCIKSGAGIALADINLKQQAKTRQQFPVLEHRKIKCHAL
jgi:nitrilase